MIVVVATIKIHGTYNTRDFEFKNKEAYDKWFIDRNDFNDGKIIGIHKVTSDE